MVIFLAPTHCKSSSFTHQSILFPFLRTTSAMSSSRLFSISSSPRPAGLGLTRNLLANQSIYQHNLISIFRTDVKHFLPVEVRRKCWSQHGQGLRKNTNVMCTLS